MMMDTYKIRKLKNEYVFIHDYIEQNMSLLNDLTASCLFRALMDVASLDDILKWREAYGKTFPWCVTQRNPCLLMLTTFWPHSKGNWWR